MRFLIQMPIAAHEIEVVASREVHYPEAGWFWEIRLAWGDIRAVYVTAAGSRSQAIGLARERFCNEHGPPEQQNLF